jgi:hypothetical protein
MQRLGKTLQFLKKKKEFQVLDNVCDHQSVQLALPATWMSESWQE